MDETPIKDSPSTLAADIAKFMTRYKHLKGTRRRFKPLAKVLMKLTCMSSKSKINKTQEELEKSLHEAILERESIKQEIEEELNENALISDMEEELTTLYGPINFLGDEDLYIVLERMQKAGHIDMLRNYAMNHYVDRYKNPFRKKMYWRRKWLEHIRE